MSSPLIHPRSPKPEPLDWARLIPGEGAALASVRKPVKSVRPELKIAGTPADSRPTLQDNIVSLLVPGPLQGRMAWTRMKSVVTDFVFVVLNWLLLGALLVPLHALFPRIQLFGYAAGTPRFLLGLGLLHAALITLTGLAEGLYADNGARGTQVLAKSVLWATAVLGLAYRVQGAPWAVSLLFCFAGAMQFGVLWARRRHSRGRSHRFEDPRHVLIIGAGGVGQRVAASVEAHPEAGRTVCGFLDDERPLGDRVIGRISDLARLARTGFVEEVILAAPRDRQMTLEVLREARRLRLDVEIVPELFGCKPAGDACERLGDLPIICLHSERLPAAGLVLKRCVDVAGATIALSVVFPLLAAIAVLIKLDSRGPLLYRAQRVGRKARPFWCLKFRTMVCNADALKAGLRRSNERSGPFFKIAADPRVTRVGKILRRYSFDELPQLWNVWKGEMSLVGPRPHPLDDFAGYEIEHLARLDVTPGITGLWQVTARRDPSFEKGMELDREYIRTWSLGTDLRILLKTFQAVVRGSGD